MDMRTRVAVASAISILAVAGALYVTRPAQPATIGGSSQAPDASADSNAAASPSLAPSPSASPRAASWTATGSMARTRDGAIAVPLLDGRVLVVGGNSNIAEPAAELYDPVTGTWTATGPMVTPRWQFAAVRLLDGRVLAASGGGEAGVLASAELYDPATGSWTATGSMETARYNATLTLLPDGRVLVAGGDIVTHFFNPSVATAELYDPSTGSWAATGSMGTARSTQTATLLRDGKVLVAGGTNDNDTLSYALASAELYDPRTGTWTPTGDMTEVRTWPSATLLSDGRVLVVGGSGDGMLASAELYDPTTGSWAATGSLGSPRGGYTATALSDGRVLVAGGRVGDDVCGPRSDSAELYDPRTRTWGATSDMIQGRSGHTATLLPDGNVLVASGRHSGRGGEPCGPGIDLLSSAELYDPGSRT